MEIDGGKYSGPPCDYMSEFIYKSDMDILKSVIALEKEIADIRTECLNKEYDVRQKIIDIRSNCPHSETTMSYGPYDRDEFCKYCGKEL
jgi:hypothetical protein